MRGPNVHLTAALTLFAILALSACSSTCPVTRTGTSSPEPVSGNTPAAGTGTGKTVTKDVPHSADSVSDIREREAKEPHPPRGDVAIPSHRIPRGDNSAAPTPPAGAGGK